MFLLRFALAAALSATALGAFWDSSPQVLDRMNLGSEAHGHRFDAQSGKILYIQGEDLNKTFLCAYDVAAKTVRKYHFADYHLENSFVYLRAADQVVVEARYSPGYGSHEESRLLQISLADGALVREIRLPADAAPEALGRPEWTDKVFVLLSVNDKTLVKTLDPKTGILGDSVPVGDFTVSHAVFLDAKPLLVLDALAQKQPRLVVFDLAAGKVKKDFPRDAGFEELQAAEPGVLGYYRPPGDFKVVVASLELENGSPKVLATIDGGIESMVQAGNHVYVIAKDHSRKVESNDRGFAPRNLHIIDGFGFTATETLPWTRRSGKLFGYDDRSRKLLYSATQPVSAFAIPGDSGSLSLAAKDLDRRIGEFWGVDDQSWLMAVLLAGVIVWGAIAKLTRPKCKSCGP